MTQEPEADACAMCHRSHSSASGDTFTGLNGQQIPSILVGTGAAQDGDTSLCFSCHGVASLGSSTDVETDLSKPFRHRTAPATSTYGPEAKDCSTCHDSHGSAKTASGTPYPALLRARLTTDTAVYSGDRYCATCHDGRPGDTWGDLVIWRQTTHADITPTASGTEIVCSVCHDPHGSENTALVVEQLTPPSASTTVGVPANDRWLCFGCHPGSAATYPGGVVYQTSSHGSSAVTVAVDAEWATRLPAASAEASRAVGECQECHAPMGVDDGSGRPVAKLGRASGKLLCYRCHGAGSSIAADVASLDVTASGGVPDVVLTTGATPSTSQFGAVNVYSRESVTDPVLDRPRRFLTGARGPAAIGDIDGDGARELLSARADEPKLTALVASDLSGMANDPGDIALLGVAEYLAVADVLDDIDTLQEVVAGTGSTVRFYRWNGIGLGPVGSVTVTGTVSGLATGDLLGTSRDEVALTTTGPDRLVIVSATSGSLEIVGDFATRSLPRGPSTGDLDGDGALEIGVANAGESTATASVFDVAGNEVALAQVVPSALRAVATAVGDVFASVTPAGTSGAELVVLRDDPDLADPDSQADIFTQAVGGGGFASTTAVDIGNAANPSAVVIANVDTDPARELCIALAGTWARAGLPSRPGLFLVHNDGSVVSGTSRRVSAGTEGASDGATGAWVAVGDLGRMGRSRHAAGAVTEAHVSTETAGFSRHVECSDCHNSHESTSTASAAPAVLGASRGTWGVSVLNAPAGEITYTEKRGVDAEYELCLKCHSPWAAAGRTRDIASEVDTRNASTHGVEGASGASAATAGSFVPTATAWTNDSVLRCTDCHGNSDEAAPPGPHVSDEAPLLRQPYTGISAADDSMLCYRCHKAEVYRDGTEDGIAVSTSRFYDADLPADRRALHSFHVDTGRAACEACHVSHGGAREHLIRPGLGWTDSADGGSCTTSCHSGGAAYSYTRP